MRQLLIALVAWCGLTAGAFGADKPTIGPAPAWVKPASLPPAAAQPAGSAVGILLSDQQIAFEPGRTTVYSAVAMKIQTPQGLAAGNISISWRPDTDQPAVHKLLIHRGDQTIDVLASGQTFTVVRREPNLESATLDGVLTANIQPEGLQVGDVLDFAYSITSSDPVLKGHVEQLAGAWNILSIGRAHLRMQWPSSLRLRLRQSGDLPALTPVTIAGATAVDLSLNNIEPIPIPKGAPPRYAVRRLVEATDFSSWADLGALLAPLYARAAVVPPTGPLRAELERIRSLSPDPKVRAQAALSLVQDRIRYVALAMGEGGLVPADAETTWSRRYGDCKAKSALLLALLHELGVRAEPVAANAVSGDGFDVRLPMIGVFNHVLVRATIGDRTFWLDGARTGDGSLDRLQTPNYGWGLPLTPAGAALVRMVPPPLEAPTQTASIRIDASAGIMAPAPAQAAVELQGDEALSVKLGLETLAGEAREQALRQYWRGQYDFIDVKSADAVFDPKTGEERLSMQGLAHMDWSSGQYETDGTGLGYKADFSRDPGPDQDAPFATSYPFYARNIETIVLPPGFLTAGGAANADRDQTVAGMQYHRHASMAGDALTIETTQRSIAPEFPAKDAAAAEKALRELANLAVYITKPPAYRPTEQDLDATLVTAPSAQGFLARGSILMGQRRYDNALSDFDRAIALDPKNPYALADRGIAHLWKGDDDAAAKDIEAASAIDPKNSAVSDAQGLAAQRKGNFKDAIAAYSATLAINPTESFALGHRAEASFAAGDPDGALRDTALALKVMPQWGELHMLRASIFQSQGKTDDALAEAATLAAHADDSYAQVGAANIFSALGKNAEAMQAYSRALAIKPEAYIYLNRALRRPRTDVAGRRADLDAALALDPKLAPAIAAKAALQIDQGDAPGAVATYSKGLELSPADPDLLSGRGVAYARSGDTARAATDFAAARDHATTPMQLNSLCWEKGTSDVALQSALADCDAALAKSPGNAAYLDSRALVLLRLGRLDEAITDYDLALAKRPDQAASLFGRAVAWSRKGDKTRATTDAAAALKADPGVQSQFETYGLKQ